MDLEAVGRHALLFDDDAMAAFVNSATALVDWNSLSIDRYDVRHLLSAPPPPRNRRPHHSTSPNPDALESELDHERYLDLSSPSQDQNLENVEESVNPNGYNAVGFSYRTASGSNEQKNTDVESGFRPSFSVPDHLLQHLPPTEKLHQIIARTAIFVSKHGGQSEIVLRVKQGDNPTFGFLLPEHNLHPYFRFLVEHKELLKSDIDGKSIEEETRIGSGLDQMGGLGGALSLLGSVYGSGEDEEAATEDAVALTEKDSEVAVNGDNVSASHGSEEKHSMSVPRKDDILCRPSFPALKEKSHVIKRNRSINGVKSVTTVGDKKDGDSMDTVSSTVDKLQHSASSKVSKVEQSILEPPTDMKRVVDKIVEFILRNGKEFEAVLVQQDTKHGRFPFLLPSNHFHPYYLNILQKAQESRSAGKSFISDKHDSVDYGMDKKTGSRENDTHSLWSDIPYEPDRKEKFKMVLGKPKKDGQDPPSKANPQPVGVSIDAAAAILQAARKGIKNPNLEILCKTITGVHQVHSSEGGDSQISSRDHSSNSQKPDKNGDFVPAPVAKAIAKTAAVAAANEADSSEASFSKEQKLKAERLKRAKMFAAMVKSGAAPLKSEPLRGLSVEPSESGFSGSDSRVIHLAGQERKSSSAPMDVDSNDRIEKLGKKESAEEHNERRLKRSYRSRSKRVEEEEDDADYNDLKQSRDHKHSRRKRHRKSHRSKDRHKHRKRHSSTQDLESDKKLDSSSEGEHRHSRHRHEHDVSLDDGRGNSRHKRDSYLEDGHRHRRWKHMYSSSDDDEPTHFRRTDDEDMHARHSRRRSHDGERRRSHRRHKHDSSSDEEHDRQAKSVKHGKTSERDPDLEEGEILIKSDQSKGSECGDGASREASVDLSKSQPAETTEVSDDLRAKIRAMLMATL